jgi:hypothetical protein
MRPFPSLSRLNLLRPPDWRIQRAYEILQQNARASKLHDDNFVVRLKEFLLWRLVAETASDLLHLRIEMPDLFLAFEFHERSEPRLLWVLEARVLAGQAPAAIAAKIGIPPEAVSAYIHAYFDVGERLNCDDFIRQEVLSPLMKNGTSVEYIWKQVAYDHGPAAFEELVSAGNRKKVPAVNAGDADEVFRGLLRHKLTVAVHSLDPASHASTCELLHAYVHLARQQRDDSPELTDIERHVKAMMDSIPWTKSDQRNEVLSPDVAKFDDCAAELRSDELMRVAAGENVVEDILKMKLPPPSRSRDGQGLEDPNSVFE